MSLEMSPALMAESLKLNGTLCLLLSKGILEITLLKMMSMQLFMLRKAQKRSNGWLKIRQYCTLLETKAYLTILCGMIGCRCTITQPWFMSASGTWEMVQLVCRSGCKTLCILIRAFGKIAERYTMLVILSQIEQRLEDTGAVIPKTKLLSLHCLKLDIQLSGQMLSLLCLFLEISWQMIINFSVMHKMLLSVKLAQICVSQWILAMVTDFALRDNVSVNRVSQEPIVDRKPTSLQISSTSFSLSMVLNLFCLSIEKVFMQVRAMN